MVRFHHLQSDYGVEVMSVDRQGPAEKVEIYRVYYSYVKAGDDGQTPAMRRGLARGPCTVEDILYFAP